MEFKAIVLLVQGEKSTRLGKTKSALLPIWSRRNFLINLVVEGGREKILVDVMIDLG